MQPIKHSELYLTRLDWVLVDIDNQVVDIYSPEEVKKLFIRVCSRKLLFTNGEEVFAVVPIHTAIHI